MKKSGTREMALFGLGGCVALLVFAWLIDGQSMTFMADDFAHLLATRTRGDLLTGYFGDWFARVPVWAVATWALFVSHWLENSWHASLLAFALHASGLVGLTAAILRAYPTTRPVPAAGAVLAFAAFALYSNVYEILFWPTCMSYSLGSLWLGVGAWVRRAWMQVLMFALAGLTYETFLAPALCALLLPVLSAAFDERRQAASRAFRVWGAAMALVLAVRGGFAQIRGAFAHVTNFSPGHMLAHMGESIGLLLRMRHYRMHTALGVSIAIIVAFAVGLAILQPRMRKAGWFLIGGTYLSTALFWVLNYGAVRAVYGAQLLLCASLVWLACHAMTRSTWSYRLSLGGLAVIGILFTRHHNELIAVKNRNAVVMADVETQWASTLRHCREPCHLVYGDLRGHLEADWVWPPNYQPIYMAWLKQKYAPRRAVTFEFVQTPPQGYKSGAR